MARILVEAVPGRCLPVPGTRGRFYGMRRAPADAPESAIVHSVPDGLRYVAEPIEVERDQYLERALARGDIREAVPAPVQPEPRRAAKREE